MNRTNKTFLGPEKWCQFHVKSANRIENSFGPETGKGFMTVRRTHFQNEQRVPPGGLFSIDLCEAFPPMCHFRQPVISSSEPLTP